VTPRRRLAPASGSDTRRAHSVHAVGRHAGAPPARIVLAYSGSLATTVAIPWLAERYRAEIVTVTIDVGQRQPLEIVRDRALAAGAARAHVLDLQDEFAREHVLRSLRADAGDADRFLLAAGATPLEWPLVARTLVDVAGIEQATAVAHGCGDLGPDPEHLDRLIRTLAPRMLVVAPAREWHMTPIEQAAYAETRGVPLPADRPGAYRVDATLWSCAIEGASTSSGTSTTPEGAYTLTQPARACPDEAAHVEIAFVRGVPTSINGVAMPLLDLVASLGTIAGAHGVGRIQGLTSRTVYESPAAVVLHRAHAALQDGVATAESRRIAELVSLGYADLIRKGLWFTPYREALEAHVNTIQARVTGEVRLALFKGDCRVERVSSPDALSADASPTYDAASAFDRVAAVVTAILGASFETQHRKA
jgi:argininosuccinate synthase